MDPRGPPNEIPINIDTNAWQIVLRHGVPTLIPRQAPAPSMNQDALVHINGTQNGTVAGRSEMILSRAAYEQGLALDYASQSTRQSKSCRIGVRVLIIYIQVWMNNSISSWVIDCRHCEERLSNSSEILTCVSSSTQTSTYSFISLLCMLTFLFVARTTPHPHRLHLFSKRQLSLANRYRTSKTQFPCTPRTIWDSRMVLREIRETIKTSNSSRETQCTPRGMYGTTRIRMLGLVYKLHSPTYLP